MTPTKTPTPTPSLVKTSLKGACDQLNPEDRPTMELYLINLGRRGAGSNTCISNTRDGVSLRYQNTEKGLKMQCTEEYF